MFMAFCQNKQSNDMKILFIYTILFFFSLQIIAASSLPSPEQAKANTTPVVQGITIAGSNCRLTTGQNHANRKASCKYA